MGKILIYKIIALGEKGGNAGGYLVDVNAFLKKQYGEMHKIGVNINQIAKKVNTTGDLYPEEMKELKEMVTEIWHILRSSPLK